MTNLTWLRKRKLLLFSGVVLSVGKVKFLYVLGSLSAAPTDRNDFPN